VLCCPQASANLLSIQNFCKDNNCFFKLTDTYFLVKDNLTGEILLQGPSEGGLYPINLKHFSKNKLRTLTAFLGAKTSPFIWHRRLGHPHLKIFHKILNSNQLPVTDSKNEAAVCSDCQLAKSRQLPFPTSQTVTHSPLELVHSDIWTSPVYSISGCKFYVIFVDDFSRYSWLFPLKHKSDMFDCFVKFKCLMENLLSCKLKRLQTDGGGEYTSHTFKQYLSKHGILHRITCPHTSQQNGIAERKHRHVIETGLALLAQSHLPSNLWVEACLTAVYLINRMPSPTLHHHTPFTKLFKSEPDYSLLRVFGCACYPLLRPYNKHKLEFRSKKCIFLGYSSNHKGYRCMDPTNSRIYLSRNVVFDETCFPAKEQPPATSSTGAFSSPLGTALLPSHFLSINSLTPTTSPVPITLPEAPALEPPTSLPLDGPSLPPDGPCPSPQPSPETSSPLQPIPPETSPPLQPIPPDAPVPAISSAPAPSPVPPTRSPSSIARLPRVTRSQTGSLKPKTFPDFHLYCVTRHPLQTFVATTLPRKPTTYRQAAAHPEWLAAMTLEFQALIDNNTWTLCPRPPHRTIIKNKWVYKLKQKADGSLDRYKARLVAKGFQQRDGIDYTETFSPVIKPATVRIVLALALTFDWPLIQLDVSNAFLHGVLTETVFMEQPPGFVHPSFPDYVCKLSKSLYGLKQAPRAWFHRLSEALLERGFVGSKVDSSLFLLHTSSVHIFFLVYVDDIIVIGNNISAINGLISSLQAEFKLKDLGSLSYFLGVHVHRDRQHLHLSQSKYIFDLLHRVNMEGAKPYPAPCTSGKRLTTSDGDPLPDPSFYHHIVGALQYCTLTRPNISFSVNQLCQFLHCPSSAHLSAAKRVLHYLKGTPDHGLLFTKGPLRLHAYCDSDWAGDPSDSKSTGGYGVFLGSSLISWQAKKQPVVSRSSTEAEYRSLAITTPELY